METVLEVKSGGRAGFLCRELFLVFIRASVVFAEWLLAFRIGKMGGALHVRVNQILCLAESS